LRVAFRFGVLDTSLIDSMRFLIGFPFLVLALLLVALSAGAALKLYRKG
jgi:hypothetical protein